MVAPLASFAVSAAMGMAQGAVETIKNALDPKAAKTRKTADDFESMFLEQTLDRMFQSVGEDGPLGDNGTGGPVYRSMLVKEYAGNIVKSGGLGIGDQVFREMMRMQEGSGHAGGN
jgi:Rod binding domain-containing protein